MTPIPLRKKNSVFNSQQETDTADPCQLLTALCRDALGHSLVLFHPFVCVLPQTELEFPFIVFVSKDLGEGIMRIRSQAKQ